MEDNTPNEEKRKKDFEDSLMKCAREMFGLKQKLSIPTFPINKKIQKKFLKHFSKKNQIEDKKDETISSEDKKTITNKKDYPSGIIKIITKNEKNQIINEEVDYKNIKENYINNIKDNVDQELIKIIENSFLLYNRRQIIKNIIQNPYSTKLLEEKILLWKFYIKSLKDEDKVLLIRKLLYYIGKSSEKIYKEFIKVEEISKAYNKFLSKGNKDKKNKMKIFRCWNNFYNQSVLLGYDGDGNKMDKMYCPSYYEEMKATMLLQIQILNIKDELNGTGCGFVFLKELKEIADMYTNCSYILESIFNECLDIININNKKLNLYRILWNYFADYFIDNSFIMDIITELKCIFGVYKQDDIVKFIHYLVLYRYNIFGILKDIKNKLIELLGPEEIYDEKEKIEKMSNIDDVLKYIEGDKKPKKKKKKKMKNKNTINIINNIEDDNNKEENIYDEINIDDSLSIISEADSILDSFKNDLIEETEFNTGNKIIPQLSSQFLKQL